MKIYHTETQEDYDALMVELEEQGIEILEKEYWKNNRHETVVFVHAIGPYGDSSRTDTTYGSLGWAFKNHPSVPITKYKAKVDEKMKIYHTETQRDFDALMIELEAVGCEWFSGRKPTEATTYWKLNSSETCVKIDKKVIAYNEKGYYAMGYPNTPITKYKAKVDDKMRFTKENVYKVFSQYRKDSNFPFNDLQDEIIKLDDTPEKVAVPKFVAEWIEWNKESGVSLQLMLGCYERFYVNRNPNCQTDGEKAVQWYVDNPYKFIQAYENGYTIEPEQLYYIPLPHLETSDGIQQVLSKRKNGTNYFASRPASALQQRYTKEELEQVPEIYKPYTKPIEEEEE